MVQAGFHASHEQFAPAELLEFVRQAEASGFAHAMCSDHFHPWSPSQGQSGFSWAWLGAALEATKLEFGTVTPPIGFRYHPAIIAQAAATLAQMYPRQCRWVALGSGEALNEHIVGQGWPVKAQRDARLAAAAEIIRALWAGETVSHSDPLPVEEARLYTRPERPLQLFCAAITPASAQRHAKWADGLLTVNQPLDQLEKVVEGFRASGGEGKPMCLQVHLSWAKDDETATRYALDNWRENIVPPAVAGDLRMPEDFVAATETVRAEDLEGRVLCSADFDRHIALLEDYARLGFERLYLHFVGPNQAEAIEAFGAHVLPSIKDFRTNG